MDLSNTNENIASWAENWPTERTDDMSEITKWAISQGWYLNEAFLFLIYRDYKEETNFSDFMENSISSEWEEHWESINRVEPSRSAIFNEAKNCFESGCYAAAIHLFFSQADGVFHDKFDKSLYKKEGEGARNQISQHISDFIARDSLMELISHHKDGSVLRRMLNEVYVQMFSVVAADSMKNILPTDCEQVLVIPNRHGVLHGMHRNYGNKINALKCFSMLLFILYAIHGEEMLEPVGI